MLFYICAHSQLLANNTKFTHISSDTYYRHVLVGVISSWLKQLTPAQFFAFADLYDFSTKMCYFQ